VRRRSSIAESTWGCTILPERLAQAAQTDENMQSEAITTVTHTASTAARALPLDSVGKASCSGRSWCTTQRPGPMAWRRRVHLAALAALALLEFVTATDAALAHLRAHLEVDVDALRGASLWLSHRMDAEIAENVFAIGLGCVVSLVIPWATSSRLHQESRGSLK